MELVLIITIMLIIITLYFRYNRPGRLMMLVPGPTALPLIGNALDIATSDSEQLFKLTRDMHSKYGGDISRLNGLHLRAVNIYHPRDIEIILRSSRYNTKHYPYNFLRPWIGNGLVTSNGDHWHHRRKMLTSAFHFSILRRFTGSFTSHTRELVSRVQHETLAAKTHAQPLITNAILGIMCETSMGFKLSEDMESSKYIESVHNVGQCLMNRIMKAVFVPDWLFQFTSMGKHQHDVVTELHKFTTKVIQKRRETNKYIDYDTVNNDGANNKRPLLDLLLEEEKKGNIDEEGIREEVDTFTFAGHDTVSATLCFMIMMVANERHIQNKIHDELVRIFGDSDRDPTVADLNDMYYLERCIKETLRLYPGVPYISRQLNEDVVLNGYTIPAHTTCNINIYDIHRRADQYTDPERFDPDRFLPERVCERHPYAYIPFSAGPRNCIGQKFAMLEMKTVMSGLLRRFRLEPVTKPQDIVFVADMVLRSKDPIYVRFRNRK